MALRKGHGNGAGSPRIEVLPPDELPSATGSITVRSERTPDGRFAAGNTVSKSGRLRPRIGVTVSLETDSAIRPYLKWGRRYAAHRRNELALMHGGTISAGVGALIETASLELAHSRYLAARAAETCDADTMKRAASLADSARQNELAAWELAAREAKAPGRQGQGSILARLTASNGGVK